ncbi:Bug family tripartite tricarboxylate transporter substrate binding protein [Variovorax sp. GB1P17]|uniref:Bug family tripartite tricarboxylate transporter substrate binding protein n=1 Tax=Variovorax sp. GB1P17 TaxID=3443740 RepID=UPI003F482FC2
MKKIFRSACLALIVPLLSMSMPNAAFASDAFPTRPIRIVVPFGPGSAPDVLARLVANKMSISLKAPVFVENRVGASGLIGTENVVRSPADGYALLIGTPSTTIAAASDRKLSFNPMKDLVPISMGVVISPLLVTGAQSPIKDVSALIAMAKAKPGMLTYASGGVGNSQHLAGEMLKQSAGIEMLHVPFQSGGAIMPALMSGQVDVAFADPAVVPLIKSGKIRALAVGSNVRSKILPGVPTVAESGLPAFAYQSWYGFLTTAGTPANVIDILNREIRAALGDADIRAKLSELGMDAAPSTPGALRIFMAEDVSRWEKVITTAQIKFE